MSDELNEVKPEEWKDENGISISRALRESGKWQQVFIKITASFRKVQEIIAAHNLGESEVEIVEAEYQMCPLFGDLKDTKDAIVKQDQERKFYAFDTTKTDLVNLPNVGGSEDEDYGDKEGLENEAFQCRRDNLQQNKEKQKDGSVEKRHREICCQSW